jgi:PAS domain S-box-containing protein
MSANPIRILLVDDDEVDRLAFLRYVDRQSLPYACKTASSVATARAIPSSEKFDIIILDHNLNDGTGFDLLPDFAQTSVIFLTGSESPEVAVRAMKAGAADYLLKDHDRNYLKLMPVAVERALRQQRDREQLVESQELFRHSFSEAPIGKAFIAPGGRFLRVNRALCELFGFSEQEFLTGGFQLVSQPSGALDGMEELFPNLNATDPHRRTEMACHHKEGQEIWIQMDIAQVPDSRGQALTYVAQIQDITGRKRAEAELKQAKEYAENIINTAPTLICGLSPDGATRFVNPATTHICGYAAGEIVGRNWWRLFYPGDSYPQAERLFAQFERGQVVNQVTTLTVRDGAKRIISWSSTNRCSATGAIIEIIGIGMDITAQCQAEEVRARLETQLYQSQKMEALGSLAGGVAHEFNNMLGAIVGYTELAKMDLGDNHPAVSSLDQVLKASQRAKDVIQQVLTFSRRQDLKRELLNLQRVAGEAVKLVRPAISPSVEITVDIAADCPPVFGNMTQLQQALTNLFTNARDAMKENGGRIAITQKTISLHRDVTGNQLGLPEGRYSVLSLSDDGQGMDAATLERVFEPFFTTKGPGKGSGLGMAVVHGIMKSHDGAVSIQSEPGKGTTVHLYFPVQAATVEEKPAAPKPSMPSGHGERILFVDDEQALVLIATKLLQRLGYIVTAFSSSQEALAAFIRQPNAFDLVITDMTMPGMTGIALADALQEARPGIPILLATGYVEQSIREQSTLLGFHEILVKPLSGQALAEAVQRALAKKMVSDWKPPPS